MRFYEILADFMNFMNFMRCGRPGIWSTRICYYVTRVANLSLDTSNSDHRRVWLQSCHKVIGMILSLKFSVESFFLCTS